MELDDLISTEPGKVDAERERPAAAAARRPRPAAVAAERRRRTTASRSWTCGCGAPTTRRRCAQAIFDRIRSERDKKVGRLPERGRAPGRRHQERQRPQGAPRLKADGRGRGACACAARPTPRPTASATRPHAKDPQFYAFLKKLEEYQRILGDNKTMLLLSTHRELFDALFQPPGRRRWQTLGSTTVTSAGPAEQRRRCTVRRRLTQLVAARSCVASAIALTAGVVQVRPGERAVVRRFGRVLEHKPEPGLWVGLPWGMDRVDRVAVDRVQSVDGRLPGRRHRRRPCRPASC